MTTVIPIPLQTELIGIVIAMLTVIVPLLAFYSLWSIQSNIRQIATDTKRIKEIAENLEKGEQD